MKPGVDRMFAITRGWDGATGLTPTTTIVPEVDCALSKSDFSSYLAAVKRGLGAVGGGDQATAVVLGPVTFVRFCTYGATGQEDISRFNLLTKILPLYQIATLGVKKVQIHEPAFVLAEDKLLSLFQQAYPSILTGAVGVSIVMVTYFEGIGSEKSWKWRMGLKEISKVSLDFIRGDNLQLLKAAGFPKTKTLGAGLIYSRSIWKMLPEKVEQIWQELIRLGLSDVCIQPAASLQYVPRTMECEEALQKHPAGRVLTFGKEKLAEVQTLAAYFRGDNPKLMSTVP
ncbi:5-methyltetrahydropteroyltriglutamate--homocysteine methyltransferase [Seminavis robusta]|uniref:5-methyltetrahydropteroyltriglutamate--homocysteine methyltransferase n=1 Tax=Seminavis robusta TaxID=568900 RepID=A0A9N8E635_9STRA|nr:5-methyltetrahydropteroyltriglutamate--homocysteine methyltransferase [Seminavis robusta]|eukprot:Sro660_g182940.1 5-methyltetrahydropteroyltriglutamate--homocysteine methyltransferase (285) ;mRNA; r:8591-9553